MRVVAIWFAGLLASGIFGWLIDQNFFRNIFSRWGARNDRRYAGIRLRSLVAHHAKQGSGSRAGVVSKPIGRAARGKLVTRRPISVIWRKG